MTKTRRPARDMQTSRRCVAALCDEPTEAVLRAVIGRTHMRSVLEQAAMEAVGEARDRRDAKGLARIARLLGVHTNRGGKK